MARRRQRVELEVPGQQEPNVEEHIKHVMSLLQHVQDARCPVCELIQQAPRVVGTVPGRPDWKRVQQGKEIEYFWHVPSGRVSRELRSTAVSGEEAGESSLDELSALNKTVESIRNQVIRLSSTLGPHLSDVPEDCRLAIQAATLLQISERLHSLFSEDVLQTSHLHVWSMVFGALEEEHTQLKLLEKSITTEAVEDADINDEPGQRERSTQGVQNDGNAKGNLDEEQEEEGEHPPPLPDEDEQQLPPLPNEPYGVIERQPVIKKSDDGLETRLMSDSQVKEGGGDVLEHQTISHQEMPSKSKRTENQSLFKSKKLKVGKREASLIQRWEVAKEELANSDPHGHFPRVGAGEHRTHAPAQTEEGKTGISDWRKRAIMAGHRHHMSGEEATTKRGTQPVAIEESAWPQGTDDTPVNIAALSTGLPEGWQAMWDPGTQRVYYGNLTTQETTWDRPTENE